MNRMKPRHLAAGAALALALALLIACGGGSGAGAPGGPSAARNGAPAADPPGKAAPQQPGARFGRAIPVQAVTVHVGKLTTNNDTTGTIVPVTQSAVASQVAGVVLSVVHQAGDWVKAGTSVVQLDDSQLKLAVQTARSNLDIARINYDIGQDNTNQSAPKLDLQVQSAQSAVDSAQKFYDSQKALLDVGGIPASQLDTARSQLQNAQANLEAARTAVDQNKKSDVQSLAQLKLAIDQAQNALQVAQLNLSYAAIKAPFAGQIAAVNVNPGTYVGLNTPVFVLVSADREVAFNVSPSDAATLPLGSTIRFTYQGKDYAARVSQAPSAPMGGLVPMVALLDRTSALGYGTVGTVSYGLTLGSGALIPIAALQVNEDQNYVFAIVNGKVASRTVKVLAESGTTAAVSGVDEGVQVVINPPPGLLEGAPVQVVSTGGPGGPGGGDAAPAGAAPAAPAPSGGATAKTGGASAGRTP